MSEVGPPGNFAALRKLEKIQAEVLLLNVDLLHIAEKITSETEDFQVEPEPEPEPKPKPSAEVKKNTQNPVVNNVLDYLNQRLQDDNE